MIIEISVAIIALAFAGLVIYLIAFLRTMRVTLGHVNQTLITTRRQLDDISVEAKKIMEHTSQLSAGIQKQMASLDPLFKSISDLGEIIENKTTLLKIDSNQSLERQKGKYTTTQDLDKLRDILELASLGICLWQKIKQRR